jgi:hypothetical protein
MYMHCLHSLFYQLLNCNLFTQHVIYLVIECVGKGQITLGRSLLNLLGAMIDVEKGTIKFTSPTCNRHDFPKGKSKSKRGRHKASGNLNASFENTWFPLSVPSSKALKKALLGDNPMFSFQYFLFLLSPRSYYYYNDLSSSFLFHFCAKKNL